MRKRAAFRILIPYVKKKKASTQTRIYVHVSICVRECVLPNNDLIHTISETIRKTAIYFGGHTPLALTNTNDMRSAEPQQNDFKQFERAANWFLVNTTDIHKPLQR